MESVVQSVARGYCRRSWWAERDDVEQEARLAVLDARPHWDPRVGVPLSAYLRKAVRRTVGRYLWALSSPVKARYGEGAGLHRAPVEDVFADPRPAPDEEADRERWHARVLARLYEIASSDPCAGIGLEVMLLEIPVREYAARTGLTRREVYACEKVARSIVSEDPELFGLWSNRP
jgi:DNA-directed RNA polymerase specialized sigma24 family protein